MIYGSYHQCLLPTSPFSHSFGHSIYWAPTVWTTRPVQVPSGCEREQEQAPAHRETAMGQEATVYRERMSTEQKVQMQEDPTGLQGGQREEGRVSL